jgi:hypothetical protein
VKSIRLSPASAAIKDACICLLYCYTCLQHGFLVQVQRYVKKILYTANTAILTFLASFKLIHTFQRYTLTQDLKRLWQFYLLGYTTVQTSQGKDPYKTLLCFLPASCTFLAWLTLRSRRWRRAPETSVDFQPTT